MGLLDFLKRHRAEPRTQQDDNRSATTRPELRDAWRALETDQQERVLELANPYLSSPDTGLSAEAKKLVALVRFRRGEYAAAVPLFREVVAVQEDAGNWFNVCTAATLGGDIELGQHAFHQALAAYKRGQGADGLSIPFMRQYYASALKGRGEYAKALVQIEELRAIYEQLKITDDTFVYIRGVPFLTHTMDVAVDVFRGLGDSTDWQQWIDSFANKLDDEGRVYLRSVKQRLANDAEQGDERKPK